MSSIFNKKYISITYEGKKNNYPIKFCRYIINKFNIKSGSKVLDIGCGNGDFSKSFKKLGMDVHSIDISDESKKSMKNRLIIHNLLKKPYPYDDETFDFIFSKSVVEHLSEPNILIDEAYRLLKSDGVFICMTPSWKHSYKESFFVDHTHITPFTRYSMEVICRLSGFKSNCEYFYQLPLLWRFPLLNIFRIFLNIFNLPYKPFSKINWPKSINNTIRFSKEAMLICKAKKE